MSPPTIAGILLTLHELLDPAFGRRFWTPDAERTGGTGSRQTTMESDSRIGVGSRIYIGQRLIRGDSPEGGHGLPFAAKSQGHLTTYGFNLIFGLDHYSPQGQE